jgi:hypothetical protein
MAHKLTVKPSAKPAMTVGREAVRGDKLVYIICTPTPRKYGHRRSRIIYIGTTEKGVRRVSSSIAHKAIDFLKRWGVKRLDVYLVTCPPRSGTQSWASLERDLLFTFKMEYGTVPEANKTGKNFTPDDFSGLFHFRRLVKVLRGYE